MIYFSTEYYKCYYKKIFFILRKRLKIKINEYLKNKKTSIFHSSKNILGSKYKRIILYLKLKSQLLETILLTSIFIFSYHIYHCTLLQNIEQFSYGCFTILYSTYILRFDNEYYF